MELLDAIKTRRNIREFTGERIPDEDIKKLLDAARYAPSPENLQMWRYVVIRDDEGARQTTHQQRLENFFILQTC